MFFVFVSYKHVVEMTPSKIGRVEWVVAFIFHDCVEETLQCLYVGQDDVSLCKGLFFFV